MNPVRELAGFVDRAASISGTYGRTRHTPERVEVAAYALLAVELVRQEMEEFTRFVYRRNELGRLLHIMADGQIPSGVWTPWGSSGKSQLTRPQRDILRGWMFAQSKNRPRPPFYFVPQRNRWHVDLFRYPSEVEALAWWTESGMNVQTWLNLHLDRRERVAKRGRTRS